jgi:hypothetical protein
MPVAISNYSLLVFLINDKVRAVECCYDPDQEKAGKKTVFKTMNEDIKVGDFVVVPTDTRYGYTVVKVVNVDIEPDLDSSAQMNWIIDPVGLAHHEQLLKDEKEAIDKARAAQKTQRRNELRAAVFAHQSEDKIKELALTNLSGKTIEHSPAPQPPVQAISEEGGASNF